MYGIAKDESLYENTSVYNANKNRNRISMTTALHLEYWATATAPQKIRNAYFSEIKSIFKKRNGYKHSHEEGKLEGI